MKKGKEMKNRIRVIRAERKLSQAKLAEMVGISRTALVAIENEKSVPDGMTIAKFVHALRIPAEDIFLALRVVN